MTLENYIELGTNLENCKVKNGDSEPSEHWVQGVLKAENHGSSFPDISQKVSSLPDLINSKMEMVAAV